MNPSPRADAAPFALELLRLLRPHQWIKNGFVFIGLLFSDASNDLGLRSQVLLAAAGFCLLSSCVYVLNDVFDRDADRAHPLKRRRPLASGSVGLGAAFALAAACGPGHCTHR